MLGRPAIASAQLVSTGRPGFVSARVGAAGALVPAAEPVSADSNEEKSTR